MLIDTHAHIHFPEFTSELDEVLARAHTAGVDRIICVGTDVEDSQLAVNLAQVHPQLWATIGLHPHEAEKGQSALDQIAQLAESPKVVGVGECGLDYFRNLSSHKDQERALRFQIELALQHDLALVFHVRDAFDDFFRIADDYRIKRGVVHCFTAGPPELEAALGRGFFIALNGIMTFTTTERQLQAARQVPLDRLVLETDCPYLSPVPKRGQRNEPANLKLTAQFLAELRGETWADLSTATSANATTLFCLPT